LEKLIAEFPSHLKAVTGRGYMLGLAMHSDPVVYVAALRDSGLLAPTAGGNTIRLLPPLIATKAELDRATTIIRAVLAAQK
jgi:acetylornithine/N-succinyldiaminopimelate aminotransferase